jgi:upstream activation factor subunit UAF30
MARTKQTKSDATNANTPVQVVDSTNQVVEKTTAPRVKKVKTVTSDVKSSSNVVSSSVTPSENVVSENFPKLASDETVAELETPLAEQSIEFLSKLQQLGLLISGLKTEYRTLEKKWTRELKAAQKQSSKRKRKAGNRAPSGFVKPTRISDELAKFLEKPTGTEMARTEVTRDINKYIRTNNLQDKENGRKINPDSKLSSLLKLKKTDELTYFNLQRYMSPHFAKAGKTEVVVVSANTVV